MKSDSISRAPLSISKSLTCQKVASVPGLDKQIRGLPSQGKWWAGRVRKRESNAGRGGALLKIHTLPFSSNTFLRPWEPWTLQQSLELQQSLSQLRPGLLLEIKMHVEQTVNTDTVFVCIVSLRRPHCSPGWPWNPCCFMASPLICWAWRDRPLTVCHSKQLVHLLNKSVGKMENFHATVKNNNQEGMRKVAWPWNWPTTSTQQKPEEEA